MINFEKKIFGQQLVTKLLPHIGLVWENRVTLGDFLKNRDQTFGVKSIFQKIQASFQKESKQKYLF